MTLPLVVFTCRHDFSGPPHDEWRDAFDTRLARFILAAGALPVPVPSAMSPDAMAAWWDRIAPDALLLSGGNDIGAAPARDGLETALLDLAHAGARPVLGLCRGMQMMTHHAGGDLVAVTDHVAAPHPVSGRIVRNRVNSFHATGLRKPPPGYSALARAPDDTIEAIRHDTLPWEGWMWHPERDDPFAQADLHRFGDLLSCAP